MQREMNSPRTPNRLVGWELKAWFGLDFVLHVDRLGVVQVDVANICEVKAITFFDEAGDDFHHLRRVTTEKYGVRLLVGASAELIAQRPTVGLEYSEAHPDASTVSSRFLKRLT